MYNPYAGNILIDRLRPLLSRDEAMAALTYLPAVHENIAEVPPHIRLHILQNVRSMHIPHPSELRLFETVELNMRSNLASLDPRNPSARRFINKEKGGSRPIPPAMSAIVEALSGVGKTAAAKHILGTLEQLIIHDDFPDVAWPVPQLVWISCTVPGSGKLVDLARALMRETDRVCQTSIFDDDLAKPRPDAEEMLNRWICEANSLYLGQLHLDEIQNLFTLPTLEARRRKKDDARRISSLSLKDDLCLRGLLTLMNSQISVLFTGTPDVTPAFNTRFSTGQRISEGGHHRFKPIEKVSDPYYQQLLGELMKHQYVADPLNKKDAHELPQLLLDLTGGVLRIIFALWIGAHRVAFLRQNTDSLRLGDFERASVLYQQAIHSPIEAVRSRDPKRMGEFSDMLPSDDANWAANWG
ncbi:AAA family ATPase [Duganella sp. BJB476]|uniref:AAA family ATPase n=1 Tax=Duganella sp. BJB476 TaxID=1871176 RepID=UPI000E34E268|nr:AAA family ATPase [Duganella sp. BJB476]RFP28740.1 ATP-binding protein [Duganella sp. BJB476]